MPQIQIQKQKTSNQSIIIFLSNLISVLYKKIPVIQKNLSFVYSNNSIKIRIQKIKLMYIYMAAMSTILYVYQIRNSVLIELNMMGKLMKWIVLVFPIMIVKKLTQYVPECYKKMVSIRNIYLVHLRYAWRDIFVNLQFGITMALYI